MHLPEKVHHFCWELVFTCWGSIHTLWWACWAQAWQGQSHSTQAAQWQAGTTSAGGWPAMVASHPYPGPSIEFLKWAFHCSTIPASIARLETNFINVAFRATFAPEHSHRLFTDAEQTTTAAWISYVLVICQLSLHVSWQWAAARLGHGGAGSLTKGPMLFRIVSSLFSSFNPYLESYLENMVWHYL